MISQTHTPPAGVKGTFAILERVRESRLALSRLLARSSTLAHRKGTEGEKVVGSGRSTTSFLSSSSPRPLPAVKVSLGSAQESDPKAKEPQDAHWIRPRRTPVEQVQASCRSFPSRLVARSGLAERLTPFSRASGSAAASTTDTKGPFLRSRRLRGKRPVNSEKESSCSARRGERSAPLPPTPPAPMKTQVPACPSGLLSEKYQGVSSLRQALEAAKEERVRRQRRLSLAFGLVFPGGASTEGRAVTSVTQNEVRYLRSRRTKTSTSSSLSAPTCAPPADSVSIESHRPVECPPGTSVLQEKSGYLRSRRRKTSSSSGSAPSTTSSACPVPGLALANLGRSSLAGNRDGSRKKRVHWLFGKPTVHELPPREECGNDWWGSKERLGCGCRSVCDRRSTFACRSDQPAHFTEREWTAEQNALKEAQISRKL